MIPLVAAEDCARVAAALLIAPDAPDQKRYDLVGETATVNEIATILSAVLNRPIHYVDIPDRLPGASRARDRNIRGREA